MKNKTPKTPTLRPQKTKKLQIGVLCASLVRTTETSIFWRLIFSSRRL